MGLPDLAAGGNAGCDGMAQPTRQESAGGKGAADCPGAVDWPSSAGNPG
jgi:hypothetical protein